MGSCLSKKNSCACSSSSSVARPNPPEKIKSESQLEKNKTEEETVKKEIFIIKHRKSQDVQRDEEGKGDVKKAEEVIQKVQNLSANNASGNGNEIIGGGAAGVRTSSCTKEELDAILIQCGRLSRSSSNGKAAAVSESGGRKYSGSKRSYDFDNESGKNDGNDVDGDEFDGVMGRGSENRHRQRNRQSSGRRRTPSREREKEQQRSGSRERSGSGGGRRVSRSPGRRSDSPITIGGTNSSSAIASSRPGKMVSVPATVSSLPIDKSGNAGGSEPNPTASIKRIQVKRNAGGDGAVGARTASSPRARSPARIRAPNENQNVNPGQIQQQPMSLSRSNSRKAEISPYRRNPLSEIDTNIISQAPLQKQNADIRIVQGAAENKLSLTKLDGNLTNSNCKTEEIQVMEDESKGSHGIAGHVGLNVVTSGPESLKPHTVTRSRSSRLSRELDMNPENLSNPSASYTALLLEDIQNFHQKNVPAFSLPSCVTKACSILEAVADLNSSTSSNISTTYSEDRRRNPITEQFSKSNDIKLTSAAGKVRSETRDPFVESELVVNNDLMEPSFHKYVTVGRGTTGLEEMEEQESSGSNSFIGSQQNWISSSCWEPNSADSTDRWTSSRSVSRENEVSPVGFQRHAVSDLGRGSNDVGKRMSTKKRDSDNQQTGIGRGRLGSRGPQRTPVAAAAAST